MPTHLKPLPARREPNWRELGARMLEREWRPLTVVDPQGLVLHANTPMRLLVGEHVRVVGASIDSVLTPASRPALAAALTQATQQGTARAALSLASPGVTLDVLVEAERLGEGDAILLVVLESARTPVPTTLAPVAGETYEILTATSRVLRRSQSPASNTDGQPCWAELFGFTQPCPDCPVRKLQALPQASGVVRRRDGGLVVVHARRQAAGVAAVTSFPIDDATYGRLVHERLEHLAELRGLTARERELLRYLLLGRSAEEIAQALHIRPRTVKYHQQNLLRKLGAESRLDLVRLLL